MKEATTFQQLWFMKQSQSRLDAWFQCQIYMYTQTHTQSFQFQTNWVPSCTCVVCKCCEKPVGVHCVWMCIHLQWLCLLICVANTRLVLQHVCIHTCMCTHKCAHILSHARTHAYTHTVKFLKYWVKVASNFMFEGYTVRWWTRNWPTWGSETLLILRIGHCSYLWGQIAAAWWAEIGTSYHFSKSSRTNMKHWMWSVSFLRTTRCMHLTFFAVKQEAVASILVHELHISFG